MAAGFMTHVTCRLTAKNWDQLQNPTLGNRVWATFTFYTDIAVRSLTCHLAEVTFPPLPQPKLVLD